MAAEGQVDDGPPLTELESLQLKANQVPAQSNFLSLSSGEIS